ncbi:pimeloyl-ACP methyl ester carboxylesterase [Motilibacter rhizosphaerae]|uniref:Pimeloyl-ACP methyl ester carboxylesterase n=1 Tax=Motilibacter rhizosphaerae TaxID=598652 RepID=A0A4V2F568_9ACTN|nr:alpha/beta hydrolase [Motilibacter rhizosphaerae]RZS91769.1 pimeloyl-ACP methyl ester carboxylesterase [Motilibacter rhizosphaerae]
MTGRPTIAFVHGAFADSSGWSATLAALDAEGLAVLAVPNPLRDLRGDAAYVRSVLATLDGPVVLVGHSYGGAVIGEAARGLEQVAALVFVAAYVLDEGESIATVLDPERFPGGLLGPATTVQREFPAEHGTDGDLWISTDSFAEVFAGDLPPDQARLMSFTQRPLALRAVTGTAAARPAWHDVRSWALVAEQDGAIPPAGQRWMAERAGATVGTVASSHAVMVAQPAAVTQTILEAVEAVAPATAGERG